MARLRREHIIDAALDLLDEHGLDALTTRLLATRLGVRAGALYWHVHDKREVLVGVADRIVGQAIVGQAIVGEAITESPPDGGWPDQLAVFAQRLRAAMLAHSDGARVVAAYAADAPATLRLAEAGLRSMHDLGLPLSTATFVGDAVASYVTGFVLQEQTMPRSPETDVSDVIAYPQLAEWTHRRQPDPRDAAFAAGLNLIISGIRATLVDVTAACEPGDARHPSVADVPPSKYGPPASRPSVSSSRSRMQSPETSSSSGPGLAPSAGTLLPGYVQQELEARSERRRPAPPLHVTNGDSAALGLRAAGFDGEVLAWRDTLHEGPVPAGLTPAELRRVRAAYLERAGLSPSAEVTASFAARDQLLEAHHGGTYVLWFEADLYDQLQLVQVVQRLAELAVEPARVTLVSIGEHAGLAHFGGLGELTPDELARLRPDGRRLGTDAMALAVEAWQAFTAPEPTALADLARRTSPTLRFLGEAVGRLMQEYPSRSDGLSLTERRILLALGEGADTAGEVFRNVWRRERRPYLGDSTCYSIVRRLAAASHPLLAIETHPSLGFAHAAVSLTPTGQEVLAGRADHVRLSGVDRWIGGMHLVGTEPAWRYDERLETLIQI